MIVLYSESFHLLHIALDRFGLFLAGNPVVPRMFWKGRICPERS